VLCLEKQAMTNARANATATTTANATAEADPYGMTKKKSNYNCSGDGNK
jgi:hypothetical protein